MQLTAQQASFSQASLDQKDTHMVPLPILFKHSSTVCLLCHISRRMNLSLLITLHVYFTRRLVNIPIASYNQHANIHQSATKAPTSNHTNKNCDKFPRANSQCRTWHLAHPLLVPCHAVHRTIWSAASHEAVQADARVCENVPDPLGCSGGVGGLSYRFCCGSPRVCMHFWVVWLVWIRVWMGCNRIL